MEAEVVECIEIKLTAQQSVLFTQLLERLKEDIDVELRAKLSVDSGVFFTILGL